MKSKILILMAALSIVACKNGSKNADEEIQAPATKADTTRQVERIFVEEPIFDINTNMGTIRVKLYKETPLHRDNFVKLVYDKFYDGILFHRVINRFMIQAGDPLSKDPSQAQRYGTGGPGYTIPAEINPNLKHKKGALAAARKGDAANPNRESSGSQFYLVQNERTCAQLDNNYTVFGETISGLDVIDKIAAVQTGPRDLPVNPVKIINIVEVVPETPAADSTAVESPEAAQE